VNNRLYCGALIYYSVPKKERGNLMSSSMMTVMKICPCLERKRRGRAVVANKMGKKRRVRERRRRGGGNWYFSVRVPWEI